MFYQETNYWLGVITGGVIWFVIQNLILPDPWSIWLARRQNFPTATLPLGIILLVLALINIIVGLGWAFLQTLGLVSFAPWVWIALAVGVVVVSIFVIVRRLRTQSQQSAQPAQNP